MTIKFHIHATVANRTMPLHDLDVPFNILSTIISFTCAFWGQLEHLLFLIHFFGKAQKAVQDGLQV